MGDLGLGGGEGSFINDFTSGGLCGGGTGGLMTLKATTTNTHVNPEMTKQLRITSGTFHNVANTTQTVTTTLIKHFVHIP